MIAIIPKIQRIYWLIQNCLWQYGRANASVRKSPGTLWTNPHNRVHSTHPTTRSSSPQLRVCIACSGRSYHIYRNYIVTNLIFVKICCIHVCTRTQNIKKLFGPNFLTLVVSMFFNFYPFYNSDFNDSITHTVNSSCFCIRSTETTSDRLWFGKFSKSDLVNLFLLSVD